MSLSISRILGIYNASHCLKSIEFHQEILVSSSHLSFIFCALQTTLKMANQKLILKGIVAAFQVALIILLITSGLHFKDVKVAKDGFDAIKDTSEYEMFKDLAFKVNFKYGALLALIILSTLKVPVIAAGLFLNHIIVLFVSFGIDIAVGGLYLAQWVLLTDSYPAGSWLGILCSVASAVMTAIFIRLIRKEIRSRHS